MRQLAFALLSAVLIVTGLVAGTASRADALMATSGIAAQWNHSCVIETAGAAYCWGGGTSGKLGNGASTEQDAPVLVSGGLSWKKIGVGENHSCGLTTGGAAYCWGYGTLLGDGTNNASNVPVAVAGGRTYTDLFVALDHTCAISSGTVWCWGLNTYGQLGDNTTTDRNAPVSVSGLTATRVTGGRAHTCALDGSGAAYCWGRNDALQLGNGTSDSHTPVLVGGGHTFTDIDAGQNFNCGIESGTKAGWCWGQDGGSQLGDNDAVDKSTPVAVQGGLQFTSITGGDQHSCGVTTSGAGYCWGSGNYGQLGLGNNSSFGTPQLVPGGQSWQRIEAASVYTCGATVGGAVQCWGHNSEGELGNNSTTDSLSPVVTWLYVGTGTTTLQVDIDPTLTFTVAGRSSVCNGQSSTNFQTGSSATIVAMGHVNPLTTGGGAQDLSIVTNAANGFSVYLRTAGTTPNSLRDASSNSIADVTGTRSSPGAAPTAGTAGFGYTSSDPSTAFTSNTWAKLTNTNDSVLIGAAGVLTKSACIGYQLAVSPTNVAGHYESIVVYTAVPSF